jgi:prophage tail gpP-like protein
MPIPQELCVVQAAGIEYKWWKEVEVVRDLNNWISTATLVVAEIGDLTTGGWGAVKLAPGVPATVMLAGQLAETGAVAVRQVSYDGDSHNVRIIIQSKVADLIKSTLDMPPGQFKNQTLKQLGSAAAGQYGIGLTLKGAIDGAEKLFERVSIHLGESPFQFITRLAQMRNVHITDDATGNLVGTRGGGSTVAELQEGKNILAAELIWSNDTAVDKFTGDADLPANNDHWSDKARATSAQATSSNTPAGFAKIIQRIIAPMPGDSKDVQMFVNHALNLNAATQFEAHITVRGWLRDSGKLWLNEVNNYIDLNSPMLMPQGMVTLGFQTVTCRQSDSTGTTTTLGLVLPDRLGAADKRIDDSGTGTAPQTPGDAKTYAPQDA